MEVTFKQKKNHNPKWSYITDNPGRIIIIAGSEIGKIKQSLELSPWLIHQLILYQRSLCQNHQKTSESSDN